MSAPDALAIKQINESLLFLLCERIFHPHIGLSKRSWSAFFLEIEEADQAIERSSDSKVQSIIRRIAGQDWCARCYCHIECILYTV